jgi:hypothetical protein
MAHRRVVVAVRKDYRKGSPSGILHGKDYRFSFGVFRYARQFYPSEEPDAHLYSLNVFPARPVYGAENIVRNDNDVRTEYKNHRTAGQKQYKSIDRDDVKIRFFEQSHLTYRETTGSAVKNRAFSGGTGESGVSRKVSVQGFWRRGRPSGLALREFLLTDKRVYGTGRYVDSDPIAFPQEGD